MDIWPFYYYIFVTAPFWVAAILIAIVLKPWRVRCKHGCAHRWTKTDNVFYPRYICRKCYIASVMKEVPYGRMSFVIDDDRYDLPTTRVKRYILTAADNDDIKYNRTQLRQQTAFKFHVLCDRIKVTHAFRVAKIHYSLINGD